MKKLKFIAVFLALFMVFPVAVYAHEGEETEASETIETRLERFERAKATFPIRLSDKEQTRLANRCVAAQQKLTVVADRLDNRSAIINKRYDLIELHLSAVQKRLVAQGIDTSIIDLLLINFQKLITQYETALSDYHNALDDAIAVGCTSEPQTFKALLEDVRAKRQVFVNSVEAIKDFTKGELKTSFDALRTRLKTRGED